MCEMTALAELHAQDGVAGLQQGEIDRHVGRTAGVRLNIGVVGLEQALGTVDGELLDVVYKCDALVVPRAGIALGIFDVQV
jgi:hypothetical protein